MVPIDVIKEYRTMLSDVLQTQRSVRQGDDDLAEIRSLIRQTRDNIGHHISTVDLLKSRLTSISRRSQERLEKPSLNQARSHRVLPPIANKKSLLIKLPSQDQYQTSIKTERQYKADDDEYSIFASN